jgi:hypothetical protein
MVSKESTTHHSSYQISIVTCTAHYCPARQKINNGISIAGNLTIPPSLKKGIRARPCHPLIANHAEKPTMVSLSVAFIFSPTLQIFSHRSLF